MNKERYTQNVSETSLSLVQTAVQAVRTKNITRNAVRIYDGASIGVAGALGSPDIGDLERHAAEGLKRGVPYPFTPASGQSDERHLESTISDPETFVAEIDAVMADLRERHKEFIFSNKANMGTTTVSLENDCGLACRYTGTTVEIVLVIKKAGSPNLIDTFIEYKGPAYSRDKFLAQAQTVCSAYLNQVELDEGDMPVCFFDGEQAYQLKLLQELSGLQYGSGSSIFSGKIGDKLFNEAVTIYQSRSAEDGAHWPHFDFEGTINPGDRYTLVENGVLKAAYTNRNYAAKFSLPLTGCAGGDYDSVPDLAIPRLVVQRSGKTAAELLNGRKALLVFIASGGDFTPDGVFASPVQNGYLFDGMRIIGRVPEVSVSSHLYKMFGEDFIGVSTDSVLPVEPSRVFIANMKVSK